MALADTARLLATLDLQDNFSGKVSGILGSVGRLQGGFGQMARGTGQVASGLGRVGLAASVAAAGGLVAIVKTAADFEQAFTGIEKTVDATVPQFAKMNEQFREMARTIPVSFEELAGIGAAGGALGIARQDLLEFTDVVARLSVSTNLSSEQAATALGHLGTILNLTGDDFRDFADSLVALGNEGASTEAEIVEVANRFAAAGRAAGLTTEQILALASATTSMGIQQEAAGSSLSRLFNSVATNIGTSNDKAKAFAKQLGLSAGEFRRAWQRDAVGTFEDFLRQLNKLDQFKAARVLKDIGITNVRDINAVRLMAQNIEDVDKALKTSETATGDLNKESQKFFDTASGQWKVLVNNIRDAGATIGNEVLPVFKDLVQQFTSFLQRPENITRLKEFGRNLAEGIKGIDFGKLIETAKVAVQIAKTAFDIFNALPGPIKAGLIGGVALNRATFGGLGLLLRGAGNIAGGALTTAFGGRGAGGVVGGLIGGRGSTPANPLFVSVVGPGGLGGGAGGAATAGGTGVWGTLGKVAGIAFAAVAVEQLAEFVGHTFFFDPAVKPAVEFEQSQFNRLIESNDPSKIQNAIEAVDSGINDLLKLPAPLQFLARDQLDELKRQDVNLREQLKVAQATQTAAFANNRTEEQLLVEAKGQRVATQDNAAAMRALALEQRLVRDKGFKTHIDNVDDFIKILKRTSEFGAKGVGTDIELGRTTGRDPLGNAFVALTRRLTPPLLKNVQVSGEISRHVQGLEQVQGRLLNRGNIEAARHAQHNINVLNRLIGEVDKTIPHFRQLEREQGRTREETRRGAAQTANHLRIMQSLERRTGDQTAIVARKDFSPKVSVTVPTTTNVSVNDVVRSVTSYTYAVNTYGGKIGNIPT